MYYPTLKENYVERQMVNAFAGYNHNLRIGEGEFYDMQNLSSANFPVMSPRQPRGEYATLTNPTGLISKDKLCYVDGESFVLGEERIDMGLSAEPKTLVSMGAYVIIMPDKKYINTADIEDRGDIEASFDTSEEVRYELCKLDGSNYEGIIISDTEPETPANMTVWLDTSAVPHTLKQYSTLTGTWAAIATTYVKITSPGIGSMFDVYDGVTISGVVPEALQDLNGTMIIWAKGDDYIVVIGLIDEVVTQTEPVSLRRQMPDLDFITEANNRLWGCRYGESVSGEIVNEIYCSKLGDFKNWNSFMGISTDSYVASCGSDGAFTGAITHMGYPLFFKENCLHKVYGNFPANFQIQTTACRGVQKGCEKSLAIVNEVLYYKSRSAVCAYDGSLPVEMSSQLGEVKYGQAVAGAHGNKLYISMRDSKDFHLFVYDTLKGMWHREDNTEVKAFASHAGEMYFISDNKIMTIFGNGKPEAPVEWFGETGVIGVESADKKYVSRITLRLSLEVGTKVSIYAEYDSSGAWEHLYTMRGVHLRSFAVPIRPRRCDHLRLRIEGKGNANIYSYVKSVEQGSDY